MVSLFRRPSPRADAPKLRPRREERDIPRVNLEELTPELVPYLAQAALVQLVEFEALARTILDAPDLAAKQTLTMAARETLDKHERLLSELGRHTVGSPSDAMRPYANRLERYATAVRGGTWCEQLTSVYLTAGMLDDFFVLLGSGLPADQRGRVLGIIDTNGRREGIGEILMAAMASDPPLASQLAMWGRRVVGDTLLIARAAAHRSDDDDPDEIRIEPVFTELIAAHSRRMDGLGLTA